MEKFKINPSKIINYAGGIIAISFHSWDLKYYIEIEDSEILLIEDKHRCFYRRNSDENVDPCYKIFEISMPDLYEYLSKVKADKFDDLIRLIKMIGNFSENWHINYRKSKVFSKDVIKRSLEMLNFLGNRVIKPTGIFPIVTNMKGDVSIRMCFKLNKNYIVEINEKGYILSSGDLFEPCIYNESFIDRDEIELVLTGVLLGRVNLPIDLEADELADKYFSDRYKNSKKEVILKREN